MDRPHPLDLDHYRACLHGAVGDGEVGGPNMVWLYRRPILDYWAEHEETLGEG